MSNDIRESLREEFELFFVQAFAEMHPDTELELAPYLIYVVAQYQGLKNGDRLVINQPPRTSKSWLAKIYAAWYLGLHPGANVMIIANKQDLAETNAYDVRKILQSPWYREIFPRTQLSPDRASVGQFKTTRGGGLFAGSMEGSLAGFGADLLILDDPNKIEDAERPDRLEKANTKFDGEIYSRLNNKKKSIVLVIQHRLHENDLSGHLIQQGYKNVSLPLIAPRNKKYRFPNGEIWFRKKGDVLITSCTKKDIERARKTTFPSFGWFYQQGAKAASQITLKPQDFCLTEKPNLTGARVISIDTAQRSGPSNSFNVLQVWQTTPDGCHYLVEQLRLQCSFTEFEQQARHAILRLRPAAVLIENAAHGAALLSRLQRTVRKVIFISVEPRRSKSERLNIHRRLIKKGKISLPLNAEWVPDYIAEFIEWRPAFSDQVDATTQYLDFMATKPILKSPPPRALPQIAFGSVRSENSPGHQSSDSGSNQVPGIAVVLGSTSRWRPF